MLSCCRVFLFVLGSGFGSVRIVFVVCCAAVPSSFVVVVSDFYVLGFLLACGDDCLGL